MSPSTCVGWPLTNLSQAGPVLWLRPSRSRCGSRADSLMQHARGVTRSSLDAISSNSATNRPAWSASPDAPLSAHPAKARSMNTTASMYNATNAASPLLVTVVFVLRCGRDAARSLRTTGQESHTLQTAS